jgi:hypothetical protein
MSSISRSFGTLARRHPTKDRDVYNKKTKAYFFAAFAVAGGHFGQPGIIRRTAGFLSPYQPRPAYCDQLAR